MAVVLVLTAITGPQVGKRHTITARVATIGSAPSSDVVVQDRLIGMRHAEIQQMLNRWFIVPFTPDGQGISLNGMPVTARSRLNAGDQLTIGATTYRVAFAELAEQEVGQVASGGAVPRLGEYLVRRGLMSSKDVSRTLERQAELQKNGTRLPFGQVAYDLGYINRAQLDAALADQRNDFNQRFLD